ncbi:YceI family protein [Actinokineospora diospyrosa]|uniref:Polyisoprenoid-binding protein YceI n=1 Tax=Actinokineospora diospyrosa TaxID=103728 RepID=A0ABT1IC88_9PSEU|nr:YceI family protein [Actinokineospora diospyrosa]MCP2269971.1 Polyisoprenoid-binding protein YceI [Actinokineospora diospyrosa]
MTDHDIQPGTYAIDPGRSTVRFRTKHVFGLFPATGSFPLTEGRITVAETTADSAATATVSAAGFASGNPTRDTQVRSATYLDAAAHPDITFTGTRFDPATDTLHGELTVKQVTKPVDLTIDSIAAVENTLTARAVTTVDRFAFGVTALPGMTGRVLRLTVEVTAVRT